GSTAYNISHALQLQGRVDIPALTRSFDEILQRHEVLRTRFISVNGEPFQEVASDHRMQLPVMDLSGMPIQQRQSLAERLALEQVQTPFDLTSAPLMRGLILRMGPDDHELLFTTHHIACDGWSVGLLAEELSALYQAFHQGRPSPLPELPLQYADFALWQRQWLQGQALERMLAHWMMELAGMEPLELPTDYPRPAVATHRGAAVSFAFS